MAISRQKKEEVVQELKGLFDSSVAAIATDYKGMDVNSLTDLRSKIREGGGRYIVAKKSLIQRVVNEAGINDFDILGAEGQIGIAFAQSDAVGVAKVVYEAQKADEKPQILAGLMGGNVLTAAEVIQLATLPSREELLAKLVGSLNAPISGFVNVLGGNLRALVYALNAIKETK